MLLFGPMFRPSRLWFSLGWRISTCVGSGKLPYYLCDPCPIGLRGGRRLKTKLRLGCHDLNVSAYRTLKRSDDARVTRAKLCCNCSLGAAEDFEHILCHCPCYDTLRSRFWNLVASVDPQLAASSPSVKVSYLLGDSTPRELSLFFYRFLQEVFSRRLAELNTQGEGFRA